jgi:hypothetical protein
MMGGLRPSIPYSQTLDLAASVTASTAPALTPDWRVRGNIQVAASLTQAEARIANIFDLSLRGELQPHVNERLATVVRDLEAEIASDQSLERTARNAWARACQPVEIGLGSGRPSVWLLINPIGFMAAQPVIGPDHVEVSLGLRSRPTVATSKPASPSCPPFPGQAEIVEKIPERSSVTLQASLDYGALNAAIAAELVRNNTVATDEVEARVSAVSLSAYGDMILAAMDAEFLEKRFIGARASGRVFVAVRPRLDSEAQVLRLESARIDARSNDLLTSVGVGGLRALAPLIEQRLSQISFDLRPQIEHLKERAAEAAARLPSSSGPLRIRQASLEDVRLLGLGHGPDGLQLAVTAQGRIALEVMRLTP